MLLAFVLNETSPYNTHFAMYILYIVCCILSIVYTIQCILIVYSIHYTEYSICILVYSIHQRFSTRVLLLLSRGSTISKLCRTMNTCIILQPNYCTKVLWASRIFPWGSTLANRLKSTAIHY